VNILLVSNLYPPIFFGGYELLAEQVATQLRSLGHDVLVLTSDFRAEDTPQTPRIFRELELTTRFPLPGESSQAVDFRLSTLHRVAERNRQAARRVLIEAPRHFADGRGADLTFCWSLNRLTLGPVLASQGMGVPVCQTVNDRHPSQFRVASRSLAPRSLLRAAAESSVFPKASLRRVRPFPVTFISHALKRDVVRSGVPFAHGEVIHQGVPLDELPFRPTSRDAGDDLRVLYVGQLSEAKGVHTLLRSMDRLAQREGRRFQLTVLGDGVPEYRQRLARMVDSSGIRPFVDFKGAVPRERVPSFYQRHHVLVFPSEWEEPFGLSHLEAMASGCAVISTTTGGSSELIRDRSNALAYTAGNSWELSERLRELEASETLRRSLVRRARHHVETHHSLEVYAAKLEDFLRRTRGRRGVPSNRAAARLAV
jgi:glycosyltransferase involved in cell wall biosynthesis